MAKILDGFRNDGLILFIRCACKVLEQVHRVSFDHESNLVKTPFERSRWRGGCYACDTLPIMGCPERRQLTFASFY
jgi:hypothetical protein